MRITEKDVQRKLALVNEQLGTHYQTDNAPQYGGYNLYLVGENSGHYRGSLGFDVRISAKEMVAYLIGVLRTIDYLKNKK